MSEQADILATFIRHPGWALFSAHVEREWGEAGLKYSQEMQKALDLTDNNAAASQARQILAAQKVIRALMRWPSEELARLSPPEPLAVPMSRRGGL